jgi:tetratricopeptide (TPR) repeat protein
MIDHNDPRLTSYVLGELSHTAMIEIDQAIFESPELAAVVEEIRNTIDMLDEAYLDEEKLSLRDEQKVSRLKTPSSSPKRSRHRWVALAVVASMAAVFIGGVISNDYFKNPQKRSREVAYSANPDGWTFHTPYTEGLEEPEPSEVTIDESEYDGVLSMPVPSLIDMTNSMRGPLLTETYGRRPIELAQQGGQQQGGGMGMGMAGKEMMGMGALASKGEGQNQQQQGGGSSSELVGGQGFWTSALLQGKNGRIIGGESAAGKMDEGQVLDEREMKEVIELALAETKKLTTESFEKQKVLLTPEESEQLIELAAKEHELLTRYGSRHPELLQVQKALKNLKSKLANKNAKEKAKPTSWKRVKAIPNTTRLMVGDKEELNLTGMQVNAQVDGFRARVLVDYFFYNDRERQLEGNFKLRLPDDASLYYFAFGESAYEYSPKGKLAANEFLQDGTQFVSLRAEDVKVARKGQWDNVKEARMVPKEKAAHAFRETVRRRVDPALVEWSGAGVFSAKVFPLAPKKLHRIVVGYDVNLKRSKDGLNFELSLPEQTGECRIELNAQEIEGVTYSVKPAVDPIPTEIDGQLQKRFIYQTGGAQDFSNIQLSVAGIDDALLRSSNEEGEFWTTQATPDLPVEEGTTNSRAIFMVDTSLSSSPDKFNVWLKLLESTLNNNRDSLKEFDVLFFNVGSQFWKGKYVANTPENVAALKQTMENLALEGATDLYGAVEAVAEAKWAGDETNRPDLFLLSDGAATWGETDLRLINRLLEQPRLGSLFAYQTGLTGTSISGLRFLAGQSGGAVFSVASEDEIKTASTAHRKRPWQLKSIEAAGASDILTAGRVQWVYPGQTITIVGRGKVDENIILEFQQANDTKTVTLTPTTIESELASRMYGQVSVGQLESLGSQVFDVSAAYARHFRVTGKTCSLLMLESEADYERFDIKPQEDLFVVKAKATSKLVSETLSKFAEQLADPKAKLQVWLSRLESMPGMQFKMPTALKLAMDDIKIEAISQPLKCTLTTKGDLSESYLNTIASENLDYNPISAEAKRRASTSVDDAIKVYSSLVERNPGDIIVARDIAFTAMEMERPAQAFHLLRRVARARPFQGNIYPAIGQCLAQMGKADMAIVYYEIAMNGTFQRQGGEFKQIVAAEYIHLLRQIVSGKLKSSVKDFAAARLETLGKHLPFGTADVVVTMMWNQDQTDVDMHVVEPSGEECYYQHKTTRSGGQITSDITTGFGPEMYYNANAPRGKYQLKAKFFGSGQNRTSTRNKVYVTIIRGFGTDSETIDRRTIQLSNVGEVEPVMTIGIE